MMVEPTHICFCLQFTSWPNLEVPLCLVGPSLLMAMASYLKHTYDFCFRGFFSCTRIQSPLTEKDKSAGGLTPPRNPHWQREAFHYTYINMYGRRRKNIKFEGMETWHQIWRHGDLALNLDLPLVVSVVTGDSKLDAFLNNKSANVLKGGNDTHMHIAHMEFSRPIASAISIPVSSRKCLQRDYCFSCFTDKEIRLKLFSNLSGVIRIQIKASQLSHSFSFYYTSLLPGKYQAWWWVGSSKTQSPFFVHD